MKNRGLLRAMLFIISTKCPCKIEPDMAVLAIRFGDMGFKAVSVSGSLFPICVWVSDTKRCSVLVFDRQQSALKNITNAQR